MNYLDLFSGTGSWKKVAKDLSWDKKNFDYKKSFGKKCGFSFANRVYENTF